MTTSDPFNAPLGERESQLLREAIAMVAIGASPRVVVAGIHHAEPSSIQPGGWRSNPVCGSIFCDWSTTRPTSWSSRSPNDRTDQNGSRQRLLGRKPGDERVRVDRPHADYFRYTGERTLVAKRSRLSAANRPRARAGPGSVGPVRATAVERGGALAAPGRRHRPARPRVGQHLVVGLRDRRDHARARCSPAPARSC